MSFLQSTKFKISVARNIYRFIKLFGGGDIREVTRQGIRYQLDISEGIDLAIYISGGFQGYVSLEKFGAITGGAILDVGANIGAMALKFAKTFKNHTVYAFEPTDYAHEKLVKNIALNPELAPRIHPIKAFLSDESCDEPTLVAYSSWKLTPTEDQVHSIHLGSAKATSHTPAFRLDDFAKENKIPPVGLIKIDTDGHELEVILGAKEIIQTQKPFVIFECGLYLLKERGQQFLTFLTFFEQQGYSLHNTKNRHLLTAANFQQEFPAKGTIDVIAVPN